MERLRYTIRTFLPVLLVAGLAGLALVVWSQSQRIPQFSTPAVSSPSGEALPTPPPVAEPHQPPHHRPLPPAPVLQDGNARPELAPLPLDTAPVAPNANGMFFRFQQQSLAFFNWIVGTPLQWLAVGSVLVGVWLLQHRRSSRTVVVEHSEAGSNHS